SSSLRLVCGELDLHLIHCESQDAPAKGAVERVVRTCREEIEDELPEEPLPLAEINSLLWSWMAVEYHGRQHEGPGRLPPDHWLERADSLRPLPPGISLDELFLHREKRTVRKDGTIKWEGKLLEVRSELSGRIVELRFDPERIEETGYLPRVFLD